MGSSAFNAFVLAGVQFLVSIGAKKVTFCFGGVLSVARVGGSSHSFPFRVSRSLTASPAHAPQAACGPPPPIVTSFASSSFIDLGSPYLSIIILPTMMMWDSLLFSISVANNNWLLPRTSLRDGTDRCAGSRKPAAVAKMAASRVTLAIVIIAATGTWTFRACTRPLRGGGRRLRHDRAGESNEGRAMTQQDATTFMIYHA